LTWGTNLFDQGILSQRARLVLDVSHEEPVAGAFAALDRPHTHGYTALGVEARPAARGKPWTSASPPQGSTRR
jgi:hypothetical protein